MSESSPQWWNTRWFLAACVLVSFVPLLYPPIPPLVDFPGHMGRYAVQLDPAPFAQWYHFQWKLIGNLGVDLLMEPMGRLFGVELGAKLIVMTIPPFTVLGLLWIAREIHGRVPPTAFFALPFAFGHPFIFGFVNYALGAALALIAFALWLRMARLGRARWRSVIFLPIACVVWTAHTFGWGLLGLLCFSAEFIRQRDLGHRWLPAGLRAALACLPMAVPLLPMLMWRSDVPAETGFWFDWRRKRDYFLMTLRDRWVLFDLASLGICLAVMGIAWFRNAFRFSRSLALGAAVMLAAYIFLPRIIFGSAYADMRLTPIMCAVMLIGIRPSEIAAHRSMRWVAMAAIAFFLVRIAANTASFAIASDRYDQALGALNHVPAHSRVFAMTRKTCQVEWSTNRMEHLAALAIIRRQAFSNDQWSVSGSSNMTIVKDGGPAFFNVDASQMVSLRPCRQIRYLKTIDFTLARLPTTAFDYVWMMDPPPFDPRLTSGMTQIWSNGVDRLYRIDR